MCSVITLNNRHYAMTSIERYVGQSTIALFYLVWRRLRVTSRERVSFMGIWTSSVQNRFI